jgi:polysaccharide pyruvyl transferase WcaK-like protein
MAKRAGVSWIFLNVGAGPLKHRLSRFFALRALRAGDYISFRDRQSQELARNLGFSGRSDVFPDNVYGFHVAVSSTAAKSNSRTVVGFAPMPYPFCDLLKYPSDVRSIQNDLTRRLSKFASLLSSHSYSLDLFASDIKADPEAIEELRRVLQQEHHLVMPEYKSLRSVDELLARMATMDYIVTCRFHGVVLAHLLNKPVLAIAHHPKVTHLMSALGLSKYCLEMDTAVPDQLMETFNSLVNDAEAIRASMAVSLKRYRSELATQFDELFPVDPARAGGRLPCVSEAFARLRAS